MNKNPAFFTGKFNNIFSVEGHSSLQNQPPLGRGTHPPDTQLPRGLQSLDPSALLGHLTL